MNTGTAPSRQQTEGFETMHGEPVRPNEMINAGGGLKEWRENSCQFPRGFIRLESPQVDDAQIFKVMNWIAGQLEPLVNEHRAMTWNQLNHVKALIAELAINSLQTGAPISATSISPILFTIHSLGNEDDRSKR